MDHAFIKLSISFARNFSISFTCYEWDVLYLKTAYTNNSQILHENTCILRINKLFLTHFSLDCPPRKCKCLIMIMACGHQHIEVFDSGQIGWWWMWPRDCGFWKKVNTSLLEFCDILNGTCIKPSCTCHVCFLIWFIHLLMPFVRFAWNTWSNRYLCLTNALFVVWFLFVYM